MLSVAIGGGGRGEYVIDIEVQGFTRVKVAEMRWKMRALEKWSRNNEAKIWRIIHRHVDIKIETGESESQELKSSKNG